MVYSSRNQPVISPSTYRTLKNMAKVADRYYRNRNKTTRVQSGVTRVGSSTQPLTGQFDYKTDYVKRRIPKRKRRMYRRKRKWNRRVINLVRNAEVGTTHLVRNNLYAMTSSNNVSNVVTFGLNGLNGFGTGDAQEGCNDISEFLKEKDPANWAAFTTNTLPSYKLWVMHGTMEMTLRNIGIYDAIIEAYYIRGKKPLTLSFSDSPGDCYKKGFSKQPTAQDPDTGATYDGPLAFDTIGTTPFQSSLFSRYYKIYKRTKFRIPPGNEVSMVIHVGRSVFSTASVKGWTTDSRYHGILFQQQGSPIFDLTNIKAAPTNVLYLSVRRYRVKMVENNYVQDAFEVTDP